MLLKLLKQAFDRGPARAEEAATPPSMAANGEPSLAEVIDYCATRVTDELEPELKALVAHRAAHFDAQAAGGSPLNVFVYHVAMGDAAKLQYRDIAIDTSRFDYEAVLRAFVDSVARWQPDGHVYLVTNPGSPLESLAAERVHVISLDVATDQPMYERVVSMCAYAQSGAFNADTLFLDSDAFLNGPPTAWLVGDFDVAVTYRDVPGLMPVNEGVMAAKAARRESARAFFRRYLATYDALRQDARIEAYYGDIRKWRGGQLSLNAVSRAAHPYSSFRDMNLDGVVLRALPCDPFNYSYSYGSAFDARELASKAVVHFKGLRKDALDAWVAFTREQAKAPAAPNASPAPSVPAQLQLLVWAARHCVTLEGDFVQIGGDPQVLMAVRRGCSVAAAQGKAWRHIAAFSEAALPDRIAFAHVDLRGVAAPLECMSAVRERLAQGAFVVLHDFTALRATEPLLDELLGGSAPPVWETPTGQALLLHR